MAVGRNPLATEYGAPRAKRATVSVSQAVTAAKGAVNAMPPMAVVGEVTGFRGPNARSGHCYFQVKDDAAAMDVIVWRSTYERSGITLRDGVQVVLVGGFDVYVNSGRLSFIARSIELAGEGLLRQQVEALAKRLAAEGLMADERKRPIPRFCMRVAVVTSLSGSVIDDVKRTLRRRNPIVELDVVGCAVQGEGAPATIVRALEVAAAARPEAILLVRGGGSFEDLMTFNDEALARAVAACPVPVITGIGHEPDVTICDMVADRRASTPTAAAESCAPALEEVVQLIERRRQRLAAALAKAVTQGMTTTDALTARAAQAMRARIEREQALLEAVSHRRCLEDPMNIVEDRLVQLAQSEERLHDAIPRALERTGRELEGWGGRLAQVSDRLLEPHEASVARMAATLDALSPLKVLGRGYAIAWDGAGHIVSDAASLKAGDDVRVRLGRGAFEARVTATSPEPRS